MPATSSPPAAAPKKKRGRPPSPTLAEKIAPEIQKLVAIATDLQTLVDAGLEAVHGQQVQLNINNLRDAAHAIANAAQR